MSKKGDGFLARQIAKFDGQDGVGEVKTRWELLPFDALEDIARVMTAGAQKYAPESWRIVDQKRYVGAMLRHLNAWMKGELIDDDLAERGCEVSHLACVACNALFILALEKGKDNA